MSETPASDGPPDDAPVEGEPASAMPRRGPARPAARRGWRWGPWPWRSASSGWRRASGTSTRTRPPPDGAVTDYPGEPDDAKATGKPAPLHFTLKDMNGVDVKLASFKGKVILLNFWATWCGPCKAEIPSLVELQQQYGDDLVVLGFSVDDTVEKMRPYAAQYKINYPLLVGNGREDVQDAFGPLFGIPVSVIIGARRQDRQEALGNRHQGPVRARNQGAARKTCGPRSSRAGRL